MIFRRSPKFLSLVAAALLAACASYVVQRPPQGVRPRTEAAIALASRPAPVAVQVSHVVDGDTFRVFVPLTPERIVSAPVRIRGLDAPELHGDCDAETAAAQEAARMLGRLLASGEVSLGEISSDKYDRVLARVFVRQNGAIRDVAELMRAAGHGRAYDGGKRAGWCR